MHVRFRAGIHASRFETIGSYCRIYYRTMPTNTRYGQNLVVQFAWFTIFNSPTADYLSLPYIRATKEWCPIPPERVYIHWKQQWINRWLQTDLWAVWTLELHLGSLAARYPNDKPTEVKPLSEYVIDPRDRPAHLLCPPVLRSLLTSKVCDGFLRWGILIWHVCLTVMVRHNTELCWATAFTFSDPF